MIGRWQDKRYSVKVPDACAGVGVKSMTPYALLRLQGVRFVLAAAAPTARRADAE